MFLSIIDRQPILSVFLFCIFIFTASTAPAVPVLKESGKRPYTTAVAASQPKRVAVSPQKNTPKVLGKFKDISSVKKPNKRYAISRHRKSVIKNLSAKSAIIIDAVSGKTLFSRKPNNPRQPASTIKVLTGMIALKSLKKDEKIPVSRKAARQPRSKVYLDQRKNYLAHDLINAVLLASANDASVALAEKIAGSENSFAKMMTLRAKLWGARNTVCKTATGLTAKGQKSTARDLAVIFKHAMEDREFAKRMKRTKARTTEGKLLRNHNKALWQVKGTQGGKTGYTNAARQTYVGKFKRGSDEIIVAIMGSERMWADLKKLVGYGFKKLDVAEITDLGSILVADSSL